MKDERGTGNGDEDGLGGGTGTRRVGETQMASLHGGVTQALWKDDAGTGSKQQETAAKRRELTL